MGFKEKVKDLWEKFSGSEEYTETYETEDELALDKNHYEEYDPGIASSEKVMRFPERTQQNLRLYYLKGQQWWQVATKVCDDFNEGCTVMINTEEANKDAIIRMVDFLSGVAYSQKGRFVKNGTTGFVAVPYNSTIGGDISEDAFGGDVNSSPSSVFGANLF